MKWIIIIIVSIICFVAQSFIVSPGENNDMLPKLSDYQIFRGTPSELIPMDGFTIYELSNTLFSDYAEKQRLIKIPSGTFMNAIGDGLPDFPDGTMLAKTFFYYRDKRNPENGKQIIETRILIKRNSSWNAATYIWNTDQTDAFLATSGSKINVHWIDEYGKDQKINYKIPSKKECASCHQVAKDIAPVGFKIRNLNKDVVVDHQKINQLKHFEKLSIMEPLNPDSFSAVPNWLDASKPIAQRARAYLDINCAHCHNPNGYCATAKLNLNYEAPFTETKIPDKKKLIINLMKQGRMPLFGTTVVHKEGLALIGEYIESIR